MTHAMTESVRLYAIQQAEVAMSVAAAMSFDENDPASLTEALAKLDAARQSIKRVECAVLSMASDLHILLLRQEAVA